MKKLLLLALVAAIAAPATLAGTQAVAKKVVKAGDVRTAVGIVNSKPAPKKAPANYAPAEGMVAVTLTAGDVWGDGSGYQMLLDADATAYGTIIPETGPLTTSGDASADVYAQFEYKIPVNADGACSTQNIVLNNSITIEIPAGTYDYCITNPTPNDRIWIASESGTVSSRGNDFVFEAGLTYVFTVTLGDLNDRVDLEIIDPSLPTLPTELTAEPAATTADVSWTPGENNEGWNLRYREVVEQPEGSFFEGFDGDGIPEGWTTIDADGDGYDWYIFGFNTGATSNTDNYDNPTFFDEGCATSASWVGGTALFPDNWLISPKVDLKDKLSVMLRGQDPDWEAEHFAIYLSTTGTNIDDFTVLVAEQAAEKTYTEYTADLSAYAGQQGYIAIRHFNVSDMFRLNVDNFQIGEIAEEKPWIVVENATNPYTIEDLTPKTTYEVQVMAFNDKGATDWTESTIFTTDKLDGVETVRTQTTESNVYYNLMGQKFTGNMPAGIYIHDGKKVVIK